MILKAFGLSQILLEYVRFQYDATNLNAATSLNHFVCIRQGSPLLRDGAVVAITPKILKTLLILIENHGKVVEREKP